MTRLQKDHLDKVSNQLIAFLYTVIIFSLLLMFLAIPTYLVINHVYIALFGLLCGGCTVLFFMFLIMADSISAYLVRLIY